VTNDQKDPTDMFHRTHSRRFARGVTAMALAALTLGAAACGGDDAAGPTQPTGPDTTEPPEGGYAHPTDPDEAILVFTRHANSTPGAIPEVVVGGDGKVYLDGEPSRPARAPSSTSPTHSASTPTRAKSTTSVNASKTSRRSSTISNDSQAATSVPPSGTFPSPGSSETGAGITGWRTAQTR